MNTIKITDKKNTLMIAHRGVSGLERENTNSAFVAAGNRSYFGIETDVHRTLDGFYVIIHDDDTARVAIDKLSVESSTFEALRSLRLTDIDGVRGRSDIRIPSLDEYISICKKYDKTAVLELKNEFEFEDVKNIYGIVASFGYVKNTIFISFEYNNLVFLRKIDKDTNVQYLASNFTDELIGKLLENNFDLDINYHSLTKERIKLCHDNGIKVNCWTVNDASDAEWLIEAGIDFITTNILE